MNLHGLKLDFSYPKFSSKFRSLARNKYTSDFNEIYKKYAPRSQIYTYQKSYQSIWLSYKFWYWRKTAISFGEECIRKIEGFVTHMFVTREIKAVLSEAYTHEAWTQRTFHVNPFGETMAQIVLSNWLSVSFETLSQLDKTICRLTITHVIRWSGHCGTYMKYLYSCIRGYSYIFIFFNIYYKI